MPQHVVIIGAVALGPKAACRFKRLDPTSQVTMIDRGKDISYGGCGIPYYISGDISESSTLQSTAFHMLRDSIFFKKNKGIDVYTETEALAINCQAKTVNVLHLPTGKKRVISYDKLVIATGSTPKRLSVPGMDLDGIYYINGLDEAEAIRNYISSGKVNSAVIVGGGFIGLEMATAFADMWGIKTTVFESMDHILPAMIGQVIARMLCRHMEKKGINFRFGEKLQRLEGNGHVERLVTDKGSLDTDIVIISVGVTPNSKLAKDSGLNIGYDGGIIVDETMRTSDPNIFAGGDCAQIKNLVTNALYYLPLGSIANRQGRIIGTNLAGGHTCFDGVSGAWCIKLFEQSAAGVGLPLQAALRMGFDAVNVHVSMLDRAHFYPEKGLMSLDLVVENNTGRILGMQGLSTMGDSLVGKVNTVSALMPHKPNCMDLGKLEMAYSPPFASAMDILNVLGNVASNILSGQNKGIGIDKFEKLWKDRAENKIFVLDCREHNDVIDLMARHPQYWHNISQNELAEHLNKLPKDRPIVTICNTGARSYEALVTLVHNGYNKTFSVEGGMAAVNAAALNI